LFFSATISGRIRDLANKYMAQPTKVSATKMVDPTKLKQVYYNVQKNMKFSLLVHLLQKENSGLVMVFCNTRSTTEFVVKNLRANRVDAIEIHGGLTQNKRTRTIDSFNNGKAGVLVCTDVAARGLHIDNVSHIYNYDLPRDPNDYVHRIGRTARAGESGKVINLLCEYDFDSFGRILHEYPDFVIDCVKHGPLQRAIVKSNNFRRNNRRRFGPRRRNYN
jgi:ATP-dependent RNA helicase DeaD